VIDLPLWELLARLGLALVLCGAIGVERETRDQAAGLRTHVAVGLGATLFTLISAYGFEGGTGRDPSRVAAQIVSGVGFLGAGAILTQGASVRGLTTAATLWVVAAIGMAAGAGAYDAAVATTVVLLVALVVLRRLRVPLLARLRSELVTLDLRLAPSAVDPVLALLSGGGVRVRTMSTVLEGGGQTVSMELRLPPRTDAQRLLRDVAALDGVERLAAGGLQPAVRELDT
jgi:putative Mg2+ transporter-C (MgtC) family protein